MKTDGEQLELDELRQRLEEAEDTLRAIRDGTVDAFLIGDNSGQRVFTLESADRPYRILVEQMPQGAATMQSDGTIIYANGKLAAMVGIPLVRLPGTNLGKYVPVRCRADFDATLALARGGKGEREIQLLQASGIEMPVLMSFGRLPSDSGAALSALVTDLTAQKHHEELAAALAAQKLAEEGRENLLTSERAARSEAERANRLKDDFLATLSHELRTPLNAVLGWAQVLQARESTDEVVNKGVTVIERNARAQAQLINDLLDMNSILSGKMRLDVHPVDIRALIEAAIESVRPAVEAKQVQLHVVLEPISEPMHGDATRLQQVVWNLLSNAVKFTPKDGHVEVTLSRVNSHIQIAVKDSGMGIKPEFLAFVFERFRQADSSTTRRHGGLGLGLSIVKQLVELHGGNVAAHSDGEGMGASFTVSLPVIAVTSVTARGPAAHPRAFSLSPASFDAPNLRDLCILVVEDEEDSRHLIQRVLEECHATVVQASSAEQALTLSEKQRFDVIVSDIGLPVTDGYSLMRELRKRGHQCPAVALTAFARHEDRARAFAAGFQMHIAKPVEPAQLLAGVASLVNQGSA